MTRLYCLQEVGFHTYATMRNIDVRFEHLMDIVKKDNLPLEVFPLDVNNDNSIKDTIDRIAQESKRIDVVVNNAGYGLIGALEDIPMKEIKAHFETNLFGVIRVMQAGTTDNEKATEWYNSKYKFYGWKNCFSILLYICWHQICS